MAEISSADRIARLIAFYLPQYHPIPENDEWWGKGFTEWTNVTRAKPLFRGHYQPQLPADLGFYDLRLPETRRAQADLAQEHGIFGFCYYHYWFNGRRVLNRPFDEVLRTGEPDFPFCLCWANENWTRRWDGRESEVLLKQNYSYEDDVHHMRWLAQAFRDPRYIRVDGKPLFLVYKASHLPDPRRTIATWRTVAQQIGIGDIYLCKVESAWDERANPIDMGFDAAVEFQPDATRYGTKLPMGNRVWRRLDRTFVRLRSRLHHVEQLYDYQTIVGRMLRPRNLPYPLHPCVTPSWDNTARRQTRATVIHGSTPLAYENWLSTTIERTLATPRQKPIIFINAWNEWAEGAHLEPCQKWGRGYLEATQHALERSGISLDVGPEPASQIFRS